MAGKYVIWGAGYVGNHLISSLLRMGYDISNMFYAVCDRDKTKHGTRFCGFLIISPEDLFELCQKDKIEGIILAVTTKFMEELKEEVEKHFPPDVKVLHYEEFLNPKKIEYITELKSHMCFRWDVHFNTLSLDWIQRFISEVKYWIEDDIKTDGRYHSDYLNRLNNRDFNGLYQNQSVAHKVFDGAVVMDIGCGCVSMFGENLPDGGKVQLIPVDPLAPFYNLLNKRFSNGKIQERVCCFGLFEFIANFYKRNHCDLIIIRNALDHCIDPYKSIIECLYILKKGGSLHMCHHMAEAEFENYSGLHQWNIDCNNNDLIIWNPDHAVNVSESLKDISDITISLSEDPFPRCWPVVTVDIVKTADFDLNQFINMERERYDLASFIAELMNWTANELATHTDLLK